MQDKSEKIKDLQKTTIIGAIANVALALFKIVFGFFSNSQALLIDGVHSFSDLITDLLVIVVTKFSDDEPDKEHPYGHQRFETIGAMVIGAFLIAVAGGIAYNSAERVFSNQLITPGWSAIFIAILSIASKEWLYRYTMKVATHTNSSILKANAWHHRTDSLSSIVVMIGLIGAYAGYNWLDPVAAVIVAVMIAKVGWDLAWNNIQELVDTAPPQDFIEKIEKIISEITEIKDVHKLRCRKAGANILLDLHIQVEPYISVSEGHQIGDCVTHRLLTQIDELIDVTVHVDPEEDEDKDLYSDEIMLPLRSEIISILQDRWLNKYEFSIIKQINIHYTDKHVILEVILPQEANKNEGLFAQMDDLNWIKEFNVCYYSYDE